MGNKATYNRTSRCKIAFTFVITRAYNQRRKAATLAVGALAVVMGYHVVFGHNGLTAFQQKREDAHALQVQAKALQLENDRLDGHVERLQNDPGAIEHQAREELHYTRSGEVIYTLPNDPASPVATPVAASAAPKPD